MESFACKHCGATVNNPHGTDMVVCATCGTLNYRGDKTLPFPEKPKRDKRKRVIPDKIILEQHADAVKVRYRWWGKQHLGLLFFTVLWNGGLLIVLGAGIADTGGFRMLLGASLHIAVGVVFGAYVLAGFINQTQIMIGNQTLEITHHGLPWFGTRNRTIDRRAIEQVYCKSRVAYTSNDRPVYVYDVHYVTKGDDDAVLVKGLDTHEKALFIEQEIERIYRIEDEPVAGEYGHKN